MTSDQKLLPGWHWLLVFITFNLLFGHVQSAADSSADQWNEFTNNFATDLAPLLALFGEQVTKQFLSESTSFFDHFIFGIAPLGIITAIVSVIRLYGSPSLKAIIGRAQEAHGVSEAELCSSTSRDVCELWSNGGICRVFGQPMILEVIHKSGKQDFYPEIDLEYDYENEPDDYEREFPDYTRPAVCNLYVPKCFFRSCSHSYCVETDGDWEERGNKPPSNPEEQPETFARHPNLSLNLGISRPRKRVMWLVVMVAIALQLSFYGYATWATFLNTGLYDEGEQPALWSFLLAMIGNVLLWIGMTLCALLIDQRSAERWFTSSRSDSGDAEPTTVVWLQPGGQRVGDQVFNAFMCRKDIDSYVTSWKPDSKENHGTLYYIILLGPALASSLVGFVLQFIGLRGLHGSITLYQLATTIVMSLVRALLRLRNINPRDNEMASFDDILNGRELDWLSVNIARYEPDAVQDDGNRNVTGWGLDDSMTAKILGRFKNDIENFKPGNEESNALVLPVTQADDVTRLLGFALGGSETGEYCFEAAYDFAACIESRNFDNSSFLPPSPGPRSALYRARLSSMLQFDNRTPDKEWRDREIAGEAIKLKNMIEKVTQYILSSDSLRDSRWRDVQSFVWVTGCYIHAKGDPHGKQYDPLASVMIRDQKGQWTANVFHLEAMISLSLLESQITNKKQSRQARKKTTRVSIYLPAKENHSDWWDRARSVIGPVMDYCSPDGAAEENTRCSIMYERAYVMEEGLGSSLRVPFITPEYNGGYGEFIYTYQSDAALVTQDIFVIFLSRLAYLLNDETLNAVHGLLGKSDQEDTRSPVVEDLCREFVDCGLGTRNDGYMCIVPPLTAASSVVAAMQFGSEDSDSDTSSEAQPSDESARESRADSMSLAESEQQGTSTSEPREPGSDCMSSAASEELREVAEGESNQPNGSQTKAATV